MLTVTSMFFPSDTCELTLDPNTAHRNLILSEDNRRVKYVEEKQPYQFHPERFDYFKQLLCRNGLTGRCYWEFETNGLFHTAVTYRGIGRRGRGDDCNFGGNDKSWSLHCYNGTYVCHNNITTSIDTPSTYIKKVAVYLDWPAGTLSFYRVSSDTLTHLYTFYSKFTEPLYPGFGFEFKFDGLTVSCFDSAVYLCQTGVSETNREVMRLLWEND